MLLKKIDSVSLKRLQILRHRLCGSFSLHLRNLQIVKFHSNCFLSSSRIRFLEQKQYVKGNFSKINSEFFITKTHGNNQSYNSM